MSRVLLAVYAALCGLTAVAALTAMSGLVPDPRAHAPHDALVSSLSTAASLLSHNALVALWPLALVALGWPQIPVVRRAGDALIAGQLVAHAVAVGIAVGAQPELWRFLPHLPVEWLGLAAPVAGWALARHDSGGAGDQATLAGVSLAALAVAASVETWAVPL